MVNQSSETSAAVTVGRYLGVLGLDLIKWALVLSLVFAYNLFSLRFPNFFLGVLMDVTVLVGSIVILAFALSAWRPRLEMTSFYAVAVNIPMVALVEPWVSGLLGVDNDMASFVILCMIFITMHYLAEHLIDRYVFIGGLSKAYVMVLCLLLMVMVLNYRLHAHFGMNTIESLYDMGRFIMADSVSWVVDNV